MSGLAALFGVGARAEGVVAMLDAAPHRGPVRAVHDGPGFALAVQEPDAAPAFVSTALARDARGAVAFVGCLYRGEGIVGGAEAAEQALAASRAGELDGLRGAYALVGADADGVWAARSPGGERPLFWHRGDGLLAVASEIKQVRTAPGPRPPVDRERLLEAAVLDRGGPDTPWVQVHRLPGGCRLRVTADGAFTHRTWSARRAAVQPLRLSLPEAGARCRALLRQAVARRLGPLTCLLMSGGIDSTAIAAEASPLSRERFGVPLTAVSGLFPEHASADESSYVGETVAALGMTGVASYPRPHPFRAVGEHAMLHDGPSVVGVPENLETLLDAARRARRPVALDGNDGDSLFGLRSGLERALMRRGAFSDLAGLARREHEAGASWSRALARHVALPLLPAPAARRLLRTRRRAGAELPPWMGDPLRTLALDLVLPRRPPTWREAQVAMYDGRIDVLLETLERIALARGATLLHPLADVDLVEFFLALPPEVKFARGEGKAVVRHSFPELPAAVTRRAYKPHFDDVAAAGVVPEELEAAIAAGPSSLPGVDWDELRRRGATGAMDGTEVAMAVRVLQADRLLAAP